MFETKVSSLSVDEELCSVIRDDGRGGEENIVLAALLDGPTRTAIFRRLRKNMTACQAQ